MSKIYVCRCGERTSRCIQCLDETCNTLREEKKELERQLEEALGLLRHSQRRVDEIKDFAENSDLVTNYCNVLYESIEEQLKEKGGE